MKRSFLYLDAPLGTQSDKEKRGRGGIVGVLEDADEIGDWIIKSQGCEGSGLIKYPRTTYI